RPEISRGPSGSNFASTSPRHPSRTPSTSCPRENDRRATARITAFRPGQSPPPVSTPTFTDAEGGNRTHTGLAAHRILSPARLPIPPLRLARSVAILGGRERLSRSGKDTGPAGSGDDPPAATALA